MGQSIVGKILARHLLDGALTPGEEIAIRIDQTLTQDATGTMAYLQFEAVGIPRVRCDLAVSYVDHNTLQAGSENADDHLFLQSTAAKFGALFSRPGNGICHQVHLERFARPGCTLLGSDSHTPTAGGIGAFAVGAGGLDVAVAMGGGAFYLRAPRVVRVELSGELGPWVSAKDVILELLRRLSVKGGVEKVFEYGGPGVLSLTVPQRATITNMGAELGATTSLFPSDAVTRAFLESQGRGEHWAALEADPDAAYDERVEIDLGTLEPLIACPHSPDKVVPVREVAGTPVRQVCIGSCTNSSYDDLARLAMILRGRTVHPRCSVTVSPGSRQVLSAIARDGYFADIVAAGVRILECACGPCIGMGQAPPTEGASVRTFNRNFEGRSGTPTAEIYLCGVEVAAACALAGEIADPRSLGEPVVVPPAEVIVDDTMILAPDPPAAETPIVRGPNIRPLPRKEPLPHAVHMRVLLKVGDNITTDHIMPAGAKVLPLRSNIPAISRHVFAPVDPEFPTRAEEWGGGFVVGGANYGQGSSREHAALAPMYLGVAAVLAKSFARIHRANLVNFGIIPLVIPAEEYNALAQGDEIAVDGVRAAIADATRLALRNETRGRSFSVPLDFTERQRKVLLAGGLLNFTREAAATGP
jgi:aconitate hydratase